MKILFLTDGIYPFVLGGMQKHTTYLIQRFAHTEHLVTVVYTAPENYSRNEIDTAVFEGVHYPNIRFIYVPWPGGIRFPGHYILKSYLYSKQVYYAVKNNLTDFDIIYNKGFSAWYLLKKEVSSIPVVTQLHGLEMYQRGFSLKEKTEKQLLRYPADFIIGKTHYHFAYGGKIKSLLLSKGVPEEKIFTQYGAVDEKWLFPEPLPKENGPCRKFLFAARYELRKGLKFLHEAIEVLEKEGLNFTVDIVGEVPASIRLRSQKLVYHGNLSADQLKQLKEKCEVLVVPSLSEGFPTVIVEAMARGLCCIATDVGAISSVVDNSNGKIISPGNTLELADAMRFFINSEPGVLKTLQHNAIEKVKQEFNWEIRFQLLLLHLESILNDSRKRSDSKFS